MDSLPNPLTPADCDLRDFPFMPMHVKRLLTSETWVLGNGEERAAAIALWLESWHQVPSASLPDNDRMLEHLSQSKRWKSVKAHALRGWVKAPDGRMYHPVVAENALEAWIEKLLNSLSGSAGNAKRWGVEVDMDGIKSRIVEAATLLQSIAPQSKTLRKKLVVAITSGSPPESHRESPPDQKSIAPRHEIKSPPESPGDRNRQGQGQGQGQGQRETKSATSALELPDWLPNDAWLAFVDMRKKIKAPLTDHAAKLAIAELEKLMNDGHRPRAVLEQSTMNSWRGLFPIKTNVTRINGERESREAFNERENARAKALLFGPEVDHAAR